MWGLTVGRLDGQVALVTGAAGRARSPVPASPLDVEVAGVDAAPFVGAGASDAS
jgi:hypothetical protein